MAALLAVVLGMGGQTFAKYVSTQNVGTNKAVVASWGLNAQMTNDMFSKTYAQENTISTDGNSVVATGESSLVAPGTNGSVTVTLGGMAEVDAEVSFAAEIVVPKIEVGGVPYYPIRWTVDGTALTNNDAESVEKAIADVTRFYEAGKTAYAETIVISWDWAFEKGTEAHNSHINDVYDTYLGQIADGKTYTTAKDDIGNYITIDETKYYYETSLFFGVSVTFTQAN